MSWEIKQNPYNFVRFSEGIVEREEKGNPLPPPDHSIFSGNSGYIKCEIENEKPLICGGNHMKKEEHTYVRFFKINDKLAIPSTSIKGMLRSFIEALTGSCLPVVDKEVLSYRDFVSPNDLKCGLVKKTATENTLGEIQEMKRIRVPINEVERYTYGDSVSFSIRGSRPKTAHIDSSSQGRLKKNNKNIETKRFERIFYNPTSKIYKFNKEQQDIYNRIVEAHMKNWERMKIPNGVIPTNYHKLKEGDLIYFQVQNEKALNLCYIEVPRLAYKYNIGHFLEKNIPTNYCNEDKLCMACRLFGYVKDRTSRTGRISITHAVIDDHTHVLEEELLKPLGSPHPTSVNLYLQNIEDLESVRDYNGAKIEIRGESFAPSKKDINESVVRLRGRKFYWHHQAEDNDILKKAEYDQKTRLNSTVEILKSRNTFKFKVYFHNLTDFELGLLLYALKLEENMRHKLGMAKNLGFGTVRIDIKALYIDNLKKKYSTLDTDYRDDKTGEVDNLIKSFKSKIPNFDQLPAVLDLRRILDPSKAPENLGYPEEPDGRNYKWYMKHKNTPLPLLLEQ